MGPDFIGSLPPEQTTVRLHYPFDVISQAGLRPFL
jgi:hypothetical protein